MKDKKSQFKLVAIRYIILMVLITVFVGFFYAYPITFTQKMIDELSGPKRWRVIIVCVLLYMLCRMIGCVLDYAGTVLARIISNLLSINLKQNFLKKYYLISSEYVYNEKFEKIYALYENDIATISNGICGPFLYFSSSVSLFLWSSATLVSIRWELAVIYMVAALLIVVITLRAGKAVKYIQVAKRMVEEKRLYIARTAIEQYMKLLIMKYDKNMITQSVQVETEYNDSQLKETKVSGAKTLVNDMIYYGAGACVWLLGSVFILSENMTTGEIVAFISFAGLIISPIVRFSSQWIAIQKVIVSKKRIDDFFALPEVKCQVVTEYEEHGERLVVDQVTFSYIEGQTLFDKLSYCFEGGKIYCIKGANGCGKSTLFKLICRIDDSYAGHIYYGKKDIREMNRENLYQLIGYEDASPVIIYGSLYDNLILGIPNAERSEVEHLCTVIGLFDSLGEAYSLDTVLEQGGKQLSNGQKQIIGIVRNLLCHKKILILDETMSGIAYPVVVKIMELYRVYCQKYGCMLLYVSHDLEQQGLSENHMTL